MSSWLSLSGAVSTILYLFRALCNFYMWLGGGEKGVERIIKHKINLRICKRNRVGQK